MVSNSEVKPPIKRMARSKKKINCNDCSEIFSRKTDLLQHKREEHSVRRQNVCHLCNRAFGSEKRLKMHSHFHNVGGEYECFYCYKQFNKAWKMKIHLVNHSGRASYICQYCGDDFLYPGKIINHLKRAHDVWYACKDCGQAYPGNLNIHKYKCKIYGCKDCTLSFASCSELATHVKVHINNDEQPMALLSTTSSILPLTDDSQLGKLKDESQLDEPNSDSQLDEPNNDSQLDEPNNDSQLDGLKTESQLDEPNDGSQLNKPINDSQLNEPNDDSKLDGLKAESQLDEPKDGSQLDEPKDLQSPHSERKVVKFYDCGSFKRPLTRSQTNKCLNVKSSIELQANKDTENDAPQDLVIDENVSDTPILKNFKDKISNKIKEVIADNTVDKIANKTDDKIVDKAGDKIANKADDKIGDKIANRSDVSIIKESELHLRKIPHPVSTSVNDNCKEVDQLSFSPVFLKSISEGSWSDFKVPETTVNKRKRCENPFKKLIWRRHEEIHKLAGKREQLSNKIQLCFDSNAKLKQRNNVSFESWLVNDALSSSDCDFVFGIEASGSEGGHQQGNQHHCFNNKLIKKEKADMTFEDLCLF
ncbi:uncharacterized protein [Procambarus clarkii]|uniref:uncharacterized protein n=1 Tax=Procambarus clarkii TaxID=6728 RepID=UPI003743E7E1